MQGAILNTRLLRRAFALALGSCLLLTAGCAGRMVALTRPVTDLAAEDAQAPARESQADMARASAKRVSLYISTPGAGRGSIQKEFAATRSNGSAEAGMRMPALEPLPASSGQDFEGRDPDAVRESGVLLYAYQPIFNGLKSGQGGWRDRLLAEGAMFPITGESLDETLLFLALSPSLPEAPAADAGRDRLRAYCAAASRDPVQDRADVRRAGLCIARFPDMAQAVVEKLGRALLADLPAGAAEATSANALLAQDLTFLYRALRRCACGSDMLKRDVLAAIARLSSPFAAQMRSCPSLNCRQFDYEAYRAFVPAMVGLIEAVMEAPDLAEDPRLAEAIAVAGNHVSRRARVPDAASISGEMERFCAEAELQYAACRMRYRRNPLVPAALVGNLGSYLLDRRPAAHGCDRLHALTREIASELRWEPDLRVLFDDAIQHFCSGD